MNPAAGSTVIGQSVVIHGELTANEDLFLDGEIEGTITLSNSRLTVGPNARILADVHARDVIIFGSIQGNIRASGRVELRQSGIVAGDISAGRLSIEESAVVKGRVELTEDPTGKAAIPSSAPADSRSVAVPSAT